MAWPRLSSAQHLPTEILTTPCASPAAPSDWTCSSQVITQAPWMLSSPIQSAHWVDSQDTSVPSDSTGSRPSTKKGIASTQAGSLRDRPCSQDPAPALGAPVVLWLLWAESKQNDVDSFWARNSSSSEEFLLLWPAGNSGFHRAEGDHMAQIAMRSCHPDLTASWACFTFYSCGQSTTA